VQLTIPTLLKFDQVESNGLPLIKCWQNYRS